MNYVNKIKEMINDNDGWVTKNNVIIVLLLAILTLSGSTAMKVGVINQKVDDHIHWGQVQNSETIERIIDLEQMKHPATASRFTKYEAKIMDNELKEWVYKNFKEK